MLTYLRSLAALIHQPPTPSDAALIELHIEIVDTMRELIDGLTCEVMLGELDASERLVSAVAASGVRAYAHAHAALLRLSPTDAEAPWEALCWSCDQLDLAITHLIEATEPLDEDDDAGLC